ncbi:MULTISPECIES: PhnD/SsuA/transferrin family substrate-binding protein [unclassified Amycolatopsis]|uniref:PhnD/SsuA/transferrin family substrate-binding protein n=1 Tax=Amycolatopsis TaxID=1813 RepID=UPI0002625D56|nr:PhnD/SsuA/transferrin family substrate-binding protein [Amycolatopsis sp. ATCC 39116]
MSNPTLAIGVYRYEHTAALLDGTVTVEGVDATFETAPLVSDIFRRMVRGDFDVAELGLTYFLRLFDQRDAPFLALPIFPNRNFRHSAIFVNIASGIAEPQDLAGKTVGEFALYGHDAGVWPKGILADDYGVTPDQCRWIIGGTNYPVPSFDWIPQPVPPGVDVRRAAHGHTLGAMLEAGEIDALISVDVPQTLLDGSPRVARLFPDYPTVERNYYRRTGIFPPMHVIAVRKELADQPDVTTALYRAFSEAKEITARQYREGAAKQHMALMTPWFSQLFAENRRLLGGDWWPYGVEANRTAIDTFLRYHHEQGLSKRHLTSEDIFVSDLLGT